MKFVEFVVLSEKVVGEYGISYCFSVNVCVVGLCFGKEV